MTAVRGIAVSCGRLLEGPIVSFSNNVGGTSELPEGRYRVELIGGFDDWETGRVLHGRLIDPEQIEIARQAGQVWQEGWKIPRLPDGRAETAMETPKVYDPTLVMFHAQGAFGQVWFPGLNE